jgi:hypothetical protein
MPIPKKKGALYFEGKDVEAFLQTYETACDEAGLTDHSKCRTMPRYCTLAERELIKNLPEVMQPTTYQALKDIMMTLYGKADRRPKYTREKLARFCREPRKIKDEADLDEYYRIFMTHAQQLTNKNMLATRDRDDLFWIGLPRNLKKLVYPLLRPLPGFSPESPMAYDKTYNQLKTLVTDNHYWPHSYGKEASPQVRKHKTKAKTSYYKPRKYDLDSDNDSSEEESSDGENDYSDNESEDEEEKPKYFEPPPPKKVRIIKRESVIPPNLEANKQLEELTRSVKEIKMQFDSFANNTGRPNQNYQPPNQGYPQRNSPATSPNNFPLGGNRRQNTNSGSSSALCWFCDKTDTHAVGMSNCPEARSMLLNNMLKYNTERKLVKFDGSPLPRGIPGAGGIRQAIINEIKQHKEQSRTVGAVSLIDEEGCSPFAANAYAIESYSYWSAPTKGNKQDKYSNSDKTSFPKQQVSVEIPPRRFGPLDPSKKLKNPVASYTPPAKRTSREAPQEPTRPQKQNSPAPSYPPGILPASILNEKAPNKVSNPEPANESMEPLEIEIEQPDKHIPKPSAAYRFTTELQDACSDKEVVGKILDQKFEITLKDFLGTAVGPAKLLAAGLKLKREYTGKSREPFLTNTGAVDRPEPSDFDSDSESEEATSSNSIASKFCDEETYKTNLVYANGIKQLFAMATGKLLTKLTGQNGTGEVLALIDTGSEINLISKDAMERLNIPMNVDGNMWSLQGINSGPEPLLGCCHEVPVEIGGKRFDHHFFVKNGVFGDHDILLGQPWLGDHKAKIEFDILPDGKRSMTFQAQEQDTKEKSTITLQALVNESRQQTKLTSNITVLTPEYSEERIGSRESLPSLASKSLSSLQTENGSSMEQEEIDKQQNLYEFYLQEATPSRSSLSGNSPMIPTIGKDLLDVL